METEKIKPKNKYFQLIKSIIYLLLTSYFLQIINGYNDDFFKIYELGFSWFLLSLLFTSFSLGYKFITKKLLELNSNVFIDNLNRNSFVICRFFFYLSLVFLSCTILHYYDLFPSSIFESFKNIVFGVFIGY